MTIEKVKQEIRQYLDQLLFILDEQASFEIEGEALNDIYVNLTGSLFSLPEERPILNALERLLRAYLHRRVGKECEVVLDVNGVVRRKRAELVGFALSAAESVRNEHKRVRLNPMSARDRRTIHVALTGFPGVNTHSVGRGKDRRIVIEPNEV
ncbi:MAG: R3H domain-containing nucleic acid-binding protein [Candidatus Bipolaricaulota bacterium]|nr:R3H domain-containing nucleic acid-binding protein [Candidatus Bipolaricaulota bacterium]